MLMTIKKDILIIDDDKDYCNLLCEFLSESFICHVANSGQAGLDLFKESCDPIIVLIDLTLPDMHGFDICKDLTQYKEEKNFASFVVSGDDQTASKIEAFNAGADDYLAKPFELKELLSRINRSIQFVERKQELKKDRAETHSLVSIAMAQASQYSYVMNFFKSLNHCHDHTQLARLFFDAMSFFQLSASLMVYGQEDVFYDATLSDISPIEKNIYELLKSKSRLYEFGARLMVNGRNASFLIKNLPADPHLAGQARDFLAALIEGMEAKLDDLALKTGMLLAISEINETIVELRKGVLEHNGAVSAVMSEMLTEIASSYHALDLTEEQEVFFTNLIEKGTNKLSGAENMLKNIQAELESIKSKMELIQITSKPIHQYTAAPADDIELF